VSLRIYPDAQFLENAHTLAGDVGLGSPLVRWPPDRDDRRCHPHDRPAPDPPGLGIYLAS